MEVKFRVHSLLGKIIQAEAKQTQKHWRKDLFKKSSLIKIHLTKPRGTSDNSVYCIS